MKDLRVTKNVKGVKFGGVWGEIEIKRGFPETVTHGVFEANSSFGVGLSAAGGGGGGGGGGLGHRFSGVFSFQLVLAGGAGGFAAILRGLGTFDIS